VALFLPEFRIAGVPSKIRTFQIVAYKLKRFTLFDFSMFAGSAECLLNNLLSRICLLRFYKHKELKISKNSFFLNDTPYLLLHWSKAFLTSF
jgi:hypothetical protein